jgi:hypothetical protein
MAAFAELGGIAEQRTTWHRIASIAVVSAVA